MRASRKRNGRMTRRRQKGGAGGPELMTAVYDGDYVRTVYLTRQMRANVNYVDPYGMTPLLAAVGENKTDENAKIVQSLLAAGADPNYRDRHGDTPLSKIIESILSIKDDYEGIRLNRSIKYINQLVKAGADINARNGEGYTPLLQTVQIEGGEAIVLKLVKALIAARADVNLPSLTGNRPLNFANNEARAELIAAGAIETPAPGQRRREGFAMEVHDAYYKINKTALLTFLQKKVGTLGDPSVDMQDHIYVSVKGFLSSAASPGSHASKDALEKSLDDIYAKRLISMDFTESEANIIQYVLEFVKRQPNKFKTMYASTFVQDCAQAYNEGNTMSCSKGVKERIIFSLSSACAAYADRPKFKENGYSTIIRILNPPSLKALIAQYSSVCLREGGTKRRFRECMLPKIAEGMDVYYNESEANVELEKFIREYEEAAGEFPSTPVSSKGRNGSPRGSSKSSATSRGGNHTRRNKCTGRTRRNRTRH
jgi:hypothetical protein